MAVEPFRAVREADGGARERQKKEEADEGQEEDVYVENEVGIDCTCVRGGRLGCLSEGRGGGDSGGHDVVRYSRHGVEEGSRNVSQVPRTSQRRK